MAKVAKTCTKAMYHIPVMAGEALDALRVMEGGLYFDGTCGGGGHSEEILKRGGRVVATDRDDDAVAECLRRLKPFGERFLIVKDNFKNAKHVLAGLNLVAQRLDSNTSGTNTGGLLDGAILDLGVSSHQIDTPERGMSYRFDAPLDMRMDRAQHLTAETVVNEYSEDELVRILFEYGEERYSRRIAGSIIRERAKEPIATTGRLVDIIKRSVPKNYQQNPAMRSFQALRIEVNNELRGLVEAIEDIFGLLKSGARLCIMGFHSLEDRIVKQTFRRLSEGCICDKSLPRCVCNHKPVGKLLGKFTASDSEIKENSRSSCATLRVIEKL